MFTIAAVLAVCPSRAEGADVVGLRLDVTDSGGTPISEISLGATFELRVFVQDLRDETVPDHGVFAAFLNVSYDPLLVSVAGPITFGPEYAFGSENAFPQDVSDWSTPGEIRDVGNAQTDFSSPLGPSEFLLFLVPFQADTFGTADFVGAPADNPPHTPHTDVLIWRSPDFVVPPENIAYGSASVSIVPEPSSFILAALGLLGLTLYAWRRRR